MTCSGAISRNAFKYRRAGSWYISRPSLIPRNCLSVTRPATLAGEPITRDAGGISTPVGMKEAAPMRQSELTFTPSEMTAPIRMRVFERISHP